MPDETKPGDRTPEDDQRRDEPAPGAAANPPRQNAEVDVRTDGGEKDPAAK